MSLSFALPALKWIPSPNYSSRHASLDKIVIHDCEGGYGGAIATFRATSCRQVSAHLVLREDGGEATQMVGFGLKAWHACAFNSSSLGIEMAGFEAKGFAVAEWREAAAITAYLCHRYCIPVKWAQKGQGPGICRHLDLGPAGGGHIDPTKDTGVWTHFLDLVEEASRVMEWPAEPWGVDERTDAAAGAEPTAPARGLAWVQSALNDLALVEPLLTVDGINGRLTKAAISAFQRRNGLAVDGYAGPLTEAAIAAALKLRRSGVRAA